MSTTMEKMREQRQKQQAGLGVFLVCRQTVYEGEIDTVPLEAFHTEQRAQEAANRHRKEAEGQKPRTYHPIFWVEVMDRD